MASGKHGNDEDGVNPKRTKGLYAQDSDDGQGLPYTQEFQGLEQKEEKSPTQPATPVLFASFGKKRDQSRLDTIQEDLQGSDDNQHQESQGLEGWQTPPREPSPVLDKYPDEKKSEKEKLEETNKFFDDFLKQTEKQDQSCAERRANHKPSQEEIAAKEKAIRVFNEYCNLSKEDKATKLENKDFLLNFFKDAPELIDKIKDNVFNFGKFTELKDRKDLMEEIITIAYNESPVTRFYIDTLSSSDKSSLSRTIMPSVYNLKINYDKLERAEAPSSAVGSEASAESAASAAAGKDGSQSPGGNSSLY